ncbi:MAG: hypothetical protein CVU24_00530 [Betaproteobacteria bacterium HGW-Betaproteobacteria-18]|nr:MAG: hypothetical protein CVU24_00530 [Betaproteobacteria bacterium HGW-Betaproteobacteria-18]
MAFLRNDPLTQLAFSIVENKGVFAVLIGSGLSRSANIPTGWEITLDLVRRVALSQGIEEQPDWAKWFRDTTGEEPNYSVLLESLATSPEERRSILHSYIEPDQSDREEGRKIPTPAHQAIASLVRSGHIRVIITTNFDRLMENALREYGVEPTVVSSVDALKGAEPFSHSQCYLLKLHGDYKDARILNTDSELNAYPKEYDSLLDRLFDEHGLIICGWSGEWDHALRAAFLRAPNRRYSVFWTTRDSLGVGAQELATHRRAKEIQITGADQFFSVLQQKVETLEQSRRQNPLSIELLINSAKRYIAKAEYRVQLDELFSQSTEQLLEKIDASNLACQVQWSQDEFRSRIQYYESVTEPLARMLGVLGRWGDGREFAMVLDIIRTLYGNAEKVANGLTVWLNMRSYPAVLAFTAYGLGLTRAQRWHDMHGLLSSTLFREHREPQKVVSTLFLWSWKGTENEVWKNIEGFSDRKTPLSDHLLNVMTEWKTSFVGVEPNFELMFDRFETLASLVSFEDNDEASIDESIATNSGEILAWMPVGRVGWHTASYKALVQELESETTIVSLLKAGFAKNSRRFLQLFIANLGRYNKRMFWR